VWFGVNDVHCCTSSIELQRSVAGSSAVFDSVKYVNVGRESSSLTVYAVTILSGFATMLRQRWISPSDDCDDYDGRHKIILVDEDEIASPVEFSEGGRYQ
jgi:hypothetical protein